MQAPSMQTCNSRPLHATCRSRTVPSGRAVVQHARARHRHGHALRRRVARGAAGPGGMFDESPTEPVTTEQRQISADLMSAMQSKISEALEADSVKVEDVYGNNQHVNIEVVAEQFEGKNAVQRQRMVYKAIWMELQDTVHAVDGMTTQTPAEASAA